MQMGTYGVWKERRGIDARSIRDLKFQEKGWRRYARLAVADEDERPRGTGRGMSVALRDA